MKFSLVYDVGKKIAALVLSDAIKSKEGIKVLGQFENVEKAIQALVNVSSGKEHVAGVEPKLNLKDAFEEANSDLDLKSKGQVRWNMVPRKMSKEKYDDFLQKRFKGVK